MKKTLIIITSLIMICIMLIGCNSTDATITTSKELNKNLNLLMNTVNRLDTIDNDYLVNNDVYSLNTVTASAVPTPNKMYKNVLASNNEINENTINEDNKEFTTLELKADEVSLKDDLTNALKNELVNRLYCDQNGNCKICKQPYTCNNNNMCNSCNQTIICDSNGNCTSCNKQLVLDNNNNCSSCKKSCITTIPNTIISPSTSSCLKRISANNEKLKVDLLSAKNNDLVVNIQDDNLDTNNEHIEDKTIINDNNLIDNDNIIANTDNFNNTSDNTTIKDITNQKPVIVDNSNTNNTTDNTTNTDNIVDNNNTDNTINDDFNNSRPFRVVYYSESSFMPDILRYSPRFVSQINYDNANTSLNKYVEKLQKLYTMTADVVEANNTLANYKIVILDNIGEAKQLNNCLLDGTCSPTNNQVAALNNYIDDIKSTIKNLRNSN